MRSLVVEDDSVSREVLVMTLSEFGESVGVARGDEALNTFTQSSMRGKPFDAVFLDIGLPGLGGLGLLRAIRAFEGEQGPENKRAAIIMLTGHAESSEILESERLGSDCYLIKPLDEERMLRELHRLKLVPDPNDRW